MSVFDGFVGQDYEDGCNQGLRLTGESRDFFAQKRIEFTQAHCRDHDVRTVIDFGCGLGHATPHLLEAFPDANIVGVDDADPVIEDARRHYAGPRVEFWRGTPALHSPADLVYCNGVFHHILPAERPGVLEQILGWIKVGGLFALWENNPWNPGTRLVMSRIPFDRDAQMLSSRLTRRLLTAAGFQIVRTDYCFFFPAALKALRDLEPHMQGLPLGAQYCVLARRVA